MKTTNKMLTPAHSKFKHFNFEFRFYFYKFLMYFGQPVAYFQFILFRHWPDVLPGQRAFKNLLLLTRYRNESQFV